MGTKSVVLVYIFLIGIVCMGWKQTPANKKLYNESNFVRVTSQADSIKDKRVIYKSLIDTSIIMKKLYWGNGKLQCRSFEKNGKGEGVFRMFYEDGRLSYDGKFKDGVQEDSQRYYFENGKIHMIEIYRRGKRIGDWKWYNLDGTILKDEIQQ